MYPNTYKGIQYIIFMTEQKSATEKKDFSFKVPFEIEILVGDSFGDGEEYFVESINDN